MNYVLGVAAALILISDVQNGEISEHEVEANSGYVSRVR